jgi:hypothetical protein
LVLRPVIEKATIYDLLSGALFSGSLAFTCYGIIVPSSLSIVGMCCLPIAFISMAVFTMRLDERGERRRWRRLVAGVGPAKPANGYVVFVAEKVISGSATGGAVEFVATPYEWGEKDQAAFRKAVHRRVPIAGVQTSWPADADVQDVAAAWFDFCQRVEELNRDSAATFEQQKLEGQLAQQLTADNRQAAAELAAVLPSPLRR